MKTQAEIIQEIITLAEMLKRYGTIEINPQPHLPIPAGANKGKAKKKPKTLEYQYLIDAYRSKIKK